MITKTPTTVAPTFEITIDGAPVNYDSINSFDIMLSEGQHDLLKVGMSGIPTSYITEYMNLPVGLSLHTGSSYSESFSGYIANVVPKSVTAHGTVNNSPFQEVTLNVMGASYRMRGKKSRLWNGYKLSQIAEELAKTYRLSMDCPVDDRVFNQIAQSEESDWQFLNRCTKQLGYSLTCHGTHLHIFDQYKASSRNISAHKLLTVRRLANNGTPHPGQILSFNGSFMDRHPDGEYMDTVVSLNDGTSIFDVRTSEVLGKSEKAVFENRLNVHVDNYYEAIRTLESTNKDLYDYEATVTAVGMLGVRPGGVVDVDNYDSRFDGLWYVSDVTHRIASGIFTTELRIKRNFNSQLESPASVVPVTLVPDSIYDRTTRSWTARSNQYRVYS